MSDRELTTEPAAAALTEGVAEGVAEPKQPDLAAPFRKFLGGEPAPLLVVHDELSEAVATATRDEHGEKVTYLPLGEAGWMPEPGARWQGVLLAVSDRASLRLAASHLPLMGPTRAVACWVGEARDPLALIPSEEWPELRTMTSRRTPGGAVFIAARFAQQVSARDVLQHLAQLNTEGPHGNGGLFLSAVRDVVEAVTPSDPSVVVVEEAAQASDPERPVPPDVVLVGPDGPTPTLPVHPVTERSPVALAVRGPLAPAVDEAVLNPRGFGRGWRDDVADLRVVGPDRFEVEVPGQWRLVVDAVRGANEKAVKRLRRLEALRITWPADDLTDTARLHARTVAGFAMAGVPMIAAPGSVASAVGRETVGDALADLIATDVETAHQLRREEHSIRLRRAALLQHSVGAWRERVAAAGDAYYRMLRPVSVLLATKRPHQLDFALRQIAKQRGVDLELVLVAHGWEPDEASIREQLGDIPVQVAALPADAQFGAVLNEAVRRASAEILIKIDDDDWYGPHAVLDLLLARHYSGADMVGTTAEFTYLEQERTTVRRNDLSERSARFVAGGSMMFDRGHLREWGGFRGVRRYVDASLLDAALSAGATIYRGHGLGYVMRRGATGHTWQAGLDVFLDPTRLADQWPGFVTSELLEVADVDLPQGLVDGA